MSINVRTYCQAYCDAGPHAGNMREAYMTLSDFKTWLRGQGWTIRKDGRVFCKEHKDAKR